MRLKNFFAPTLKETPADAVALSHKLMLRAGLVRMLSAGIYSYLPLGWTVLRKAEQIVREEMERIGAQEFQLPALNPLDIWEETGRASGFGDEMFRLKDRKGHPHCLAPTHEEIICSIARGHIRSYRDLPQTWFQIQTKFRDEPRPRGGLLRIRQFIMKDSYSLDRDEEGLDRSYELHREAYERIFQRCGLDYFIVGASSGLMGGAKSQEFMFESESGEDEVARCDACGYAANIEVAASKVSPVTNGIEGDLKDVSTPNLKTVEEVSDFLNLPQEQFVKTLIYIAESGPVIALVSGEDELSESKLLKLTGSAVRPADADEVIQAMGVQAGFLGPHGKHKLTIYADNRLKNTKGLATGANKDDYHVVGLDMERDVQGAVYEDLRVVSEGEACPNCGESLRVVKCIELGHIFKLGTKYSDAMGATFLDEEGNEQPIIMGSYGIGIERIMAAAIEAGYDENGLRWNSSLSPMDAIVIPFNVTEESIINTADEIYGKLKEAGFRSLIDNRDARPGVKMKDADLMGIPVHIIVSPRNLEKREFEIKDRWTGDREYVKADEIVSKTREIIARYIIEVS